MRLNYLNMCNSYFHTLSLIGNVSKFHAAPLKKWIDEGMVFKFIGDNVDKQLKVRDIRSDHQAYMLHMYSVLVTLSRTQATLLPHTGHLSSLSEVPAQFFLPTRDDVSKLKADLVVLVSRVLCEYFPQLSPFRKFISKHSIPTQKKCPGSQMCMSLTS